MLFGWLLVRAWLLPGRLAGPGRLAPRQVGLIEVANSLLLLVAVGVTYG